MRLMQTNPRETYELTKLLPKHSMMRRPYHYYLRILPAAHRQIQFQFIRNTQYVHRTRRIQCRCWVMVWWWLTNSQWGICVRARWHVMTRFINVNVNA